MISYFILIFYCFVIGFSISNIIRLKVSGKCLREISKKTEEIKKSDLTPELKCIQLDEILACLEILGKFNYFAFPQEVVWKEKRREAKREKKTKQLLKTKNKVSYEHKQNQ